MYTQTLNSAKVLEVRSSRTGHFSSEVEHLLRKPVLEHSGHLWVFCGRKYLKDYIRNQDFSMPFIKLAAHWIILYKSDPSTPLFSARKPEARGSSLRLPGCCYFKDLTCSCTLLFRSTLANTWESCQNI